MQKHTVFLILSQDARYLLKNAQQFTECDAVARLNVNSVKNHWSVEAEGKQTVTQLFARPAFAQPVPDGRRLRFRIYFVCIFRTHWISPEFHRIFPDRVRHALWVTNVVRLPPYVRFWNCPIGKTVFGTDWKKTPKQILCTILQSAPGRFYKNARKRSVSPFTAFP